MSQGFVLFAIPLALLDASPISGDKSKKCRLNGKHYRTALTALFEVV